MMDETTKVGEMKPEDQVKLWQNRVELGKRYQAKYGDVDGRWTKNINALAGDFNSAAEIGPDAVARRTSSELRERTPNERRAMGLRKTLPSAHFMRRRSAPSHPGYSLEFRMTTSFISASRER